MSIAERIVQPCKRRYANVEVLVRLNSAAVITNPRSNEINFGRSGAILEKLSSEFSSFAQDEQSTLPVGKAVEKLTTIRDHYEDEYTSYRNIAFVMENQRRLWGDVLAKGLDESDLYVIVRPDLYYLDPLPLAAIETDLVGGTYDLLVPRWHSCGGLNDRFAVCNAHAASAYMLRGASLVDYALRERVLQSERFLDFTMRKAGVRVGNLAMVAVRVRASGLVSETDKRLMKEMRMQHPIMPALEPGVVTLSADPIQRTSDRIRSITGGRHVDRYLEIGVQKGHTFFRIEAGHKVAVDPKFRFKTEAHRTEAVEFHQVTSDEYFSSRWDGRKFDLIFIDGLHVFEQALRDFCNSLTACNARSLLVIDDTIPSDVFSALRSQELAVETRRKAGGVGRAWHGDVFKVVMFIHDYLPTLSYVTISTGGNPQTFVWFEPRKNVQPRFGTLEAISRATYFDLQDNIDVMNLLAETEAIRLVRESVYENHRPGE